MENIEEIIRKSFRDNLWNELCGSSGENIHHFVRADVFRLFDHMAQSVERRANLIVNESIKIHHEEHQ